jgi:hypothetical protein
VGAAGAFAWSRTTAFIAVPPVTRAAIGNDARNIMIAAQVRSSSTILQPPLTYWIPFKGYCMGSIGNG